MGEDFLSEGQFNIEVVEKEKIRISVRNLVEFVFRSGDIDNRVGKGVQKEAMQRAISECTGRSRKPWVRSTGRRCR